MQFFSTIFGQVLTTLLLSMVPVLELRAAIPVGIAAGLPPLVAWAVACIGNLLPAPVIILLVRRVIAWLRQRRFFGGRLDQLEQRAHLKGRMVKKYRLLGLILLVAIPLPGTGAWTGALVAAYVDLPLRRAMPAIALGVAIAGAITTGVTCGVIHIFW